VSSALVPDDCYFVGYAQDIFLPLDANGTRSVMVKLTTKRGINRILMDNFEGKISSQIAEITAMAAGMPYYITGTISNGGILPANNIAKFTVDYYLKDKYENAIGNSSILISTNLTGETNQTEHFSDTNGLIRFYYGPKISILTANITAIAKDNISVKKNLIANFVSSGVGSNIILVITPETMASRDSHISTTREARVVGILTDAWGNPVENKTVTFTLSSPAYDKVYNVTGNPSLSKASETTDSSGNAIVTFYPGSFSNKTTDLDYSDSATGSCIVTAKSGTLTSNPITVEWKNFAYLSVAVNVTPQTVHVNDTVDVTIRITGDGYKMVQNPITVVLDMDTSSSMNGASANETNGLDRFNNSKLAGKYLVGSLSSQDQVGLVTYGDYDNSIYWQLVSNVTYNRDNVNTSIDSLEMKGGLEVSVRDSIHEAVNRITTNPLRPVGEVAAIITLGDSGYQSNDFAPMVLETWTQNKIRIYTIQYVSTKNGCSTGDTKVAAMHTLADNAGGIPFCCTNKNEVYKAIDDIKQNLSSIAGVDTSMDLDFSNVTYVNNGTTMSGNDTVSYVPVGPFVNHTKSNVDPAGRTSIIWTDGNQSVVNQTDDWNDDFHLDFTIGTIHIKETWETTFRIRVNKEGIIDLFGPGSTISYNNKTGKLSLPATYIISLNTTIPIGLSNGTLSVTNLFPDDYSNYYIDSVPMTWKLKYKGFDQATETYWYCYQSQPCVQFGSSPPISSTEGLEIPRNTNLDVTNFPLGVYRIKVIASVPGIPSAEDSGAFTKVSGGEKPYIKLE
jgi:hypothetical protein